MTEPEDISIGENHRRGISSALTLLDEMLCDFERWAKGAAACGPLYSESNDLGPKQRQTILEEIEILRAMLVDFRDTLALPRKVERVAASIWFRSSLFWETLVELESKHLRRYGAVPPVFAADFDPKVKFLIKHLEAIADAAHRTTDKRGRTRCNEQEKLP